MRVMDCVFCGLMESGEARWVAREMDSVAFLPLPDDELAPGHTLVIPRNHCVGVLDARSADLVATISLVQRVGLAMQTALGSTGVVVLNASGRDSGQSIAHFHFHVVPCWGDDEATFWPSDRSRHTLEAGPHLSDLLAEALEAPGAS